MSPELLFLHQYNDGELNRFDVIVRYLMIEQELGNNNIGKELYLKMQAHRAGDNLKMAQAFIDKKDSFTDLIQNVQKSGYRADSPIILNRQNKLFDGSHRLATALYFNIPEIPVKRSRRKYPQYGLNSFDNFTEQELNLIKKTERDILSKINLPEVLNETLQSQPQVFGRGTFYQSFEKIGIDGQRPTQKRFDIYDLEQYLHTDLQVLDIGCNCGFFALHIAPLVKHIDGVEFNRSLVQIANISKLLLNIDNTNFTAGDFNKVALNKKYDLILSFAVHYWIGQDIKDYSKRLWNLLNDEGLVLFESQNIEKEDLDWDVKIAAFIKTGFIEISSGKLCDDGSIHREFSLFKKPAKN